MQSLDAPAPLRIGVIGTYGAGNLGDESVFVAFLQWMQRHALHVHPVALCVDPAYIEQEYRLPAHALAARRATGKAQGHAAGQPPPDEAVPPTPTSAPSTRDRLRNALKRIFPAPIRAARAAQQVAKGLLAFGRYLSEQVRVVRSLDAVLVLGGGQVHDFWDGALGYPATLFSWALACRLARKPSVIASIGAVELRHPMSRWLIRNVFRWSTYASVRDEPTAAIVRSLGVDRACRVLPDLAWGLRRDGPLAHGPPRIRPAWRMPVTPPRTIGVCPMIYRHPRLWPAGDADAYAHYIAELASFCGRLSREGYKVALFPTQIRSDVIAIRDITSRIEPYLMRNVRVCPVEAVEDLLDCLAGVDAVVSSRFHGLLLSLLMGRPAMSLSYQPKNDALLEELGQRHFALDIHQLSANALWSAFVRLCSESAAYAARIGPHIERNRHELDQQYREILERLSGWAPGDRPPPSAPLARERDKVVAESEPFLEGGQPRRRDPRREH